MSNQAELALTEPQTAIAPASPMQMIQRALDAALASGEGLTVANLILDQMRQQRDYEDKAAFQAALRRIQDELKPIVKRGDNPETRSKFARAEDIDAVLDGLLTRERMTLSFEPRESSKPEEILVVGTLTLGGYSKEYPLPMPCDGKGAKGGGVMSRTHATGSAITYAKRYLKDMIFNLTFKDKDDDGNAAGGNPNGMRPETLQGWMARMHAAADPGQLFSIFREGYKAAEVLGDKSAMFDLIQCNKIEKARYKE